MTDAEPFRGMPPETPHPDLRASDADRERVAERLRDAMAEGRLDMEEFEERLDATYKARTYGELAPITRDLPAAGAKVSMVKHSASGETVPAADWADRIVGGEASSTWGVGIMGGFQRKGRWVAPRRFTAFTFWGGGEIDLRDADFTSGETTLNCIAIMGGVNVVVPPGVEVVVRGIGIMGGFDHRLEGERGDPGAPRVIVTGLAFWGGVGTARKLPKAERKRLKEERRQERLERREARRLDRTERIEAHQDRVDRRIEAHQDRVERRLETHQDRIDRRRERGRD